MSHGHRNTDHPSYLCSTQSTELSTETQRLSKACLKYILKTYLDKAEDFSRHGHLGGQHKMGSGFEWTLPRPPKFEVFSAAQLLHNSLIFCNICLRFLVVQDFPYTQRQNHFLLSKMRCFRPFAKSASHRCLESQTTDQKFPAQIFFGA